MSNKKIIVTGGSRGIGKSIVKKFLENGNEVAYFSQNLKNLEESKKEFDMISQKSYSFCVNAINQGEVEKFFDEVLKLFGTVDVLVNNVGGGGRWGNEIYENTPFATWDEVFNKNTKAAYTLIMKALPFMREKKWGRVITISSILGKEGGGRPWFTMSKAAQIAIMKSLSKTSYLVKDNITFNTIAPGAIMTENAGWEKMKKENPNEYNNFVNNLPMGKLGVPEDVANLTFFLASEEAKHINGSCITVDGGETNSF